MGSEMCIRDSERFDEAAERLRSRLRADGHEANVPGPGPLAE